VIFRITNKEVFMTIDYHLELINIIKNNTSLMKVFDVLEEIGLENYYLGAGAITQTIWNHKSNNDPTYGISDIDIVYYDEDALEKMHEEVLQKKLLDRLPDFSLWLDVKNQARVHLWYEDKFGYKIKPYLSVEAAIDTWPTSASAVGIRRKNNKWMVYAPFGLEDLFNMVVRANNRQITEEIYITKVKKWQGKWPSLTYVEWDDKELVKNNNPIRYVD